MWKNACAGEVRSLLRLAFDTAALRGVCEGSFFLGGVHGSHFPGHSGFEFFVFFVVGREFIEHVVRIFIIPVLLGIVVGQFGGATLMELLVSRVGQRRIGDNGGASITAFDEVTGANGVIADCNGVFLPVDFAGNGDIANFAGFSACREEMPGEFGEGLALVVVGLFVDINVLQIPIAEGFEHTFAFRALNVFGDSQAIKRSFAVTAFADEDDLSAVAGHAGGQGSKPAGAGGVAGTGFFEVGCDFPGNFWSGC